MPDLMTREQQVARILREKHGWELTPAQVRENLQRAYRNIRQMLKARGHQPPEDDEGLRQLIREALAERGRAIATGRNQP